jgi:hypothetical protein
MRIASLRGQVLNLGSPKYEVGVLTTRPQRSVVWKDERCVCMLTKGTFYDELRRAYKRAIVEDYS